ncbi:protein phosphatase 1 regulatory subunit 14B-like [Oppia nitens]|uniref:protein phosphatase 1 regulatory subunit 14B-like n=1 Tax=Oppia nitens TaxID=1686743 RepID=UPI0023DA1C4D|nr:protein phosphatase 1 regulatory subunit 14B-like [Oppia nitens]
MECSLPTNTSTFASKRSPHSPLPKPMGPKEGPTKSQFHVNFNTEKSDLTDRKKKYLTAKYGQHQMNLIKKRLRVEMWMYEQLQALYNISDDSNDVEIDLDELLDIEEDIGRKEWLRNKIIDAKQSKDVVESFIVELLEKAKTL